jgi:hypothetical protein
MPIFPQLCLIRVVDDATAAVLWLLGELMFLAEIVIVRMVSVPSVTEVDLTTLKTLLAINVVKESGLDVMAIAVQAVVLVIDYANNHISDLFRILQLL